MKALKSAIVIASVLGLAATLGACQREEHTPMKLGASDLVVEQSK